MVATLQKNDTFSTLARRICEFTHYRDRTVMETKNLDNVLIVMRDAEKAQNEERDEWDEPDNIWISPFWEHATSHDAWNLMTHGNLLFISQPSFDVRLNQQQCVYLTNHKFMILENGAWLLVLTLSELKNYFPHSTKRTCPASTTSVVTKKRVASSVFGFMDAKLCITCKLLAFDFKQCKECLVGQCQLCITQTNNTMEWKRERGRFVCVQCQNTRQ